MQCPSCQFHNMPGVPVCGRCGAQLRLSAALVDVHPPRASPVVKRLRRWFPLYRLGYRALDLLSAVSPVAPSFARESPATGVLLRMLVPGWPQVFLGDAARGRILLAAYLLSLAGSLFFVGTQTGSLLLGFTLMFHAISVVDAVCAGISDSLSRLIVSAACLAAVALAVYFPVLWTTTRLVNVRQVQTSAGFLQAGDVLLYRPVGTLLSAPSVGDVVLYRIPHRDIAARTGQGNNVVYRLEGELIDRIIAGPGQSVAWASQLLVDGRPSAWQPVNPDTVHAKLEFRVPDGCYGILPSMQPQITNYPDEVLRDLCIVPHEFVLGRPVWRPRPLSRWGPIR